jgi:hypothetical protein
MYVPLIHRVHVRTAVILHCFLLILSSLVCAAITVFMESLFKVSLSVHGNYGNKGL